MGLIAKAKATFVFNFKSDANTMRRRRDTQREREESGRDVDEEGKATVCTTIEKRKKMATNLPIGKVKFCT